MPSTEIATSKPMQLITRPEDIITVKEAEIERARIAIDAMENIPEFSKHKVSRARGRLRFMESFVELLKEGFIAIPRMEYDQLHEYTSSLYFEKLPVGALTSIAELKDKFDDIGIVRPKSKKRDPIVIGILRYGGLEEHFILAWWRPDIMRPDELW